MKILILSTTRYPADFVEKFEEYTHSPNPEIVKGLDAMSKVYLTALKLGHQVDVYKTRDLCNGKQKVDLSKYDKIFFKTEIPKCLNYSLISAEVRDQLLANQDKIIRVLTDPIEVIQGKEFYKAGFVNSLHTQFNIDRMHFRDDEDFENWVKMNRRLMNETTQIIPTFFDYTTEEKMKCFGEVGKHIVCINFSSYYKKCADIPFAEKKNAVCKCVGTMTREIPGKFFKNFKLDPESIENIGATFIQARRVATKHMFLSEYDVQKAYAGYRFIVSPTYAANCLAWHRTRFLYSAMNGCIILGSNPEIQNYGEAYQLDSSIFTKSEKEQQAVAEAQAEWFFKRLMPDEQAVENIRRVLDA